MILSDPNKLKGLTCSDLSVSLCVCVCDWQVQNITQSMEVLDLRTYRDLQYVRDTENLMKTVDGRLKTASENPRSLNPKSFQVSSLYLF